MKGIITNLSDDEVYTAYIDLKNKCSMCRFAHEECRIKPQCKICELGYMVKKLDDVFSKEV